MKPLLWISLLLSFQSPSDTPRVVARVPLNPPLTCGQDSLFVFLQAIGRSDIRLSEIEMEMPNGPTGASMQQMLDFCRKRGIEAHLLKDQRQNIDGLPVPSILSVKGNHFIVYLGRSNDTIRFFDNATGVIETNDHWFQKNMGWSGVALANVNWKLTTILSYKAPIAWTIVGLALIIFYRRQGPQRTAITVVSANRPAFTLVESIIVIGIISLLLAISLPAIQMARASAANAACRSHLRQIGIAALSYESTYGFFATDGGGPPTRIPDINGNLFQPWEEVTTIQTLSKEHSVGDPNLSPQKQGGSFLFSILPQVGYATVYQNRKWSAPIAVYSCAARRNAAARIPPVKDEYGQYRGGGWAWAQSDYAVNFKLVAGFGNNTRKVSSITDGQANTILAGEKALNPKNYLTGTWLFDSPFFFGGTLGSSRGMIPSIVFDGPDFTYTYKWGACHPLAANFVFADGAVHQIAYQSLSSVVESLTTINAGD